MLERKKPEKKYTTILIIFFLQAAKNQSLFIVNRSFLFLVFFPLVLHINSYIIMILINHDFKKKGKKRQELLPANEIM